VKKYSSSSVGLLNPENIGLAIEIAFQSAINRTEQPCNNEHFVGCSQKRKEDQSVFYKGIQTSLSIFIL